MGLSLSKYCFVVNEPTRKALFMTGQRCFYSGASVGSKRRINSPELRIILNLARTHKLHKRINLGFIKKKRLSVASRHKGRGKNTFLLWKEFSLSRFDGLPGLVFINPMSFFIVWHYWRQLVLTFHCSFLLTTFWDAVAANRAVKMQRVVSVRARCMIDQDCHWAPTALALWLNRCGRCARSSLNRSDALLGCFFAVGFSFHLFSCDRTCELVSKSLEISLNGGLWIHLV